LIASKWGGTLNTTAGSIQNTFANTSARDAVFTSPRRPPKRPPKRPPNRPNAHLLAIKRPVTTGSRKCRSLAKVWKKATVVTVTAADVKSTKKKKNVNKTCALKDPVLSGKESSELLATLSKTSLNVHATAVTAPRLYTNAEAPSSRVINTATTTTTKDHATGTVVIAVIWTAILLSSSYIAKTASASILKA